MAQDRPVSQIAEFTSRTQESLIDAFRQVSDLTVSAVSSASEMVAGFIPDLPNLPFVDQLPEPRDAVSAAYDFAGAWLTAQKDYAIRLAEAMQPLTSKVADSSSN